MATALATPDVDNRPPRKSAQTTKSEAGRAGWWFSTPFLVVYVLFLIGRY